MLAVEGLTKHFGAGIFRAPVKAVEDVSFTVRRGETFGLVGASGSGKSTIARLILRLLPSTGGAVRLDGLDLLALKPGRFLPYRRRLQIVFQQPTLALDPKQTVAGILMEPLFIHRLARNRKEAMRCVMPLLEMTSLTEDILPRRVAGISGGQAQRVVLARALALEPEIIVADEPTSMLDVSVQARILRILQDIGRRRGLTLILISHDPSVIRALCDSAALMDHGRLVRVGPPDRVLQDHHNPEWRQQPNRMAKEEKCS